MKPGRSDRMLFFDYEPVMPHRQPESEGNILGAVLFLVGLVIVVGVGLCAMVAWHVSRIFS